MPCADGTLLSADAGANRACPIYVCNARVRVLSVKNRSVNLDELPEKFAFQRAVFRTPEVSICRARHRRPDRCRQHNLCNAHNGSERCSGSFVREMNGPRSIAVGTFGEAATETVPRHHGHIS